MVTIRVETDTFTYANIESLALPFTNTDSDTKIKF